MFYSNSSKIQRFKHLMIELNRIFLVGKTQFVYFEDLDDVRTISMLPYHESNESHDDGASALILAVIGKQQSYYIASFVRTIVLDCVNLRISVKFFDSVYFAYNFTKWHKNVLLLQDTMGPSSVMPLPYRTTVHELYFQNQGHTYSPFFFLQTFETSLWIYFLTFSIFVLGCLWIWIKTFGKRERRRMEIFDFISLTLGNSINFVTSTISYRILLLSFLILLVIFYSAFSARLDALLAIKKIHFPFASVKELIRRDDYTLCVSRCSQVELYVKYLRDEINGSVNMTSPYCPQTNPVNLGWLKDFTFRCNKTNMSFFFSARSGSFEKYLISQCSLIKFPGKYFSVQPTFVTSLEFSFRDFLNHKIIKARTSGHIDYITNLAYFKGKSPVGESSGHENLQIEFEHCKLMILFLIVGAICAFIVLGFEIIRAKCVFWVNNN